MKSKTEKLAIFGASGFGREVAWLAENAKDAYEIVCFIDDDYKKKGLVINGLSVVDFEQFKQMYRAEKDVKIICATGNPTTREILAERIREEGFGSSILIHRSVEISRWVEIEEGAVICAGSILTTNIKIGKHVHINLNCTIGHDTIIGDFTTLSPGVHISGCVLCGRRVFIGSGAVIINGTQDKPLVIGDDVIIGAGAVVLGDIGSGFKVAGVPAKTIG